MTRKYAAFARIALVQAATERGELYGRALFFAVILGVFTALWRAVAEAGMPSVIAPAQLVWYLAATEWILLSAPQLQQEIQEDVRRGDIACQLLRPVSYLGAKLAQGAGTLLVRAPVLGVTAFACAYAFTGVVPSGTALSWLLPLGLSASLLLMGLYVFIGLLSFWLSDVTPIYWVWQKLLFVLGGLMLPIELYPSWVQRVAALTPFSAILAGPAGFILRPLGGREALWLVARHGVWFALVALGLALVFRRATHSLQIGGG